MKKKYAAAGYQEGNERVVYIDRGSTRSHCVENSLPETIKFR
jgi:hypothetical protein